MPYLRGSQSVRTPFVIVGTGGPVVGVTVMVSALQGVMFRLGSSFGLRVGLRIVYHRTLGYSSAQCECRCYAWSISTQTCMQGRVVWHSVQ